MTKQRISTHWFWRFFNPFLWIFFPTKVIFPDTICFDGREVTIIRKSLFGIINNEQRVPADHVASVRLRTGIFTGTILTQTSGGNMDNLKVTTLPKRAAAAMVEDIRRVALRSSG